MRVRVLYFAGARDMVGIRVEAVSVKDEMTASKLLDALVASHPRLGSLRDSLRVAVNQEVVPGSAPVREGDEVAILPPVAGG